MWELKPGVFVGNINARVREKIWEKITTKWFLEAILMHNAQNEQGYAIKSSGNTEREVLYWEGLYLIAKKAPQARSKKEKTKEEEIEKWDY